MPSPTYELFVQAMIEERPVRCAYGGHLREVSPIMLGYKKGEEAALVYQYAGVSSSRLPDWKCFDLAKVSSTELGDGRSREPPPTHGSAGGINPCVPDVDLDVNPNSPYHPKRQLSEMRRRTPRSRKALLAAAPLEDIDLTRERDFGRNGDL